MVKINSAFLQNITENLPALSQAEIGNLSARAVYRIAMAPGIEQQECAAKVHELSERAIAATTAVQPNLIAKFFQRIKNLLGSSHRWKTDHQLLSLVWEKLQLLPAGVFAITKAAAEVGHVDAQFSLGQLYADGEGVEKDMQEAFRWYKEAAKKGHIEAQNQVGYCYRRGSGVKNDMKKAIKWFERSAEKNNVVAVCALGYIFSRNEDYDKAVMWFEKGAALGSQLAAEELEALRPHIKGTSAQD